MITICPRTMQQCTTTSMCAPYGGCGPIARIASLEPALASAKLECEQSRKTIAELRETIKGLRNVMLNAYWALHEDKQKKAFDLLDAALQGGTDAR